MNKHAASIVSLALLGVFCVQPVSVLANFKPAPLPAIRIQNDGTLSPATPLIQRNGDVYTLLGNLTDHVLAVECSNIVLDGAGFSICGNGAENGITLTGVRNVTASNFNVVDCNSGFFLNCSVANRILQNNVSKSNYYCNFGIQLSGSGGNQLWGNTFIHCYYDLYLKDSGNNTLRNNRILSEEDKVPPEYDVGVPSSAGIDFVVLGSTLSHFLNDIDASNTINGRAICYWTERNNQTVPPDAAYVALVNCRNITVENQNLYNTQGVVLSWTTASVVKDCFIHGGLNGVTVISSTNCTVSGNQIWGNIGETESGGDGVSLVDSQAINIVGNKILGNWNAGVTCAVSSNSLIKGNTITENWHNGISLLSGSDGNALYQNYIYNHTTMSRAAIYVENSQNNMIIANNLTGNDCWGMQLLGTQQNNAIYCNNFVNNSKTIPGYTRLQVSMMGSANADVWDNGTVGNYWSDYLTRYPNASETARSGVGDTPFVINENNIDHYPAMTPINFTTVGPLPSPPLNESPTPLSSTEPSPTQMPAPTATDSLLPSSTVPEMPTLISVVALGVVTCVAVVATRRKPRSPLK
jgi:parallel beta-helix repeat protein